MPRTRPTLPTIELGGHQVTRLIIGGNPFSTRLVSLTG